MGNIHIKTLIIVVSCIEDLQENNLHVNLGVQLMHSGYLF